MVEKLISEGSKVIAVGRRQDRVDDFVRKHGSKAGGIAYDINDSFGAAASSTDEVQIWATV